jgi:hypothetical protein
MAEVARILANPEDLKEKLEDMNEMSKENPLAVQWAMDHRSNLIETLSKIMKEVSTTHNTLIQNIRK